LRKRVNLSTESCPSFLHRGNAQIGTSNRNIYYTTSGAGLLFSNTDVEIRLARSAYQATMYKMGLGTPFYV
jgi:hypothetical protein